DLLAGRGSGGANIDPALRTQRQEPGGHLAAAGVVHADEQDLGLILASCQRRPFVAFTVAACIPSATWYVSSTLTFSKPAASSPATYSLVDSAPAMQPT